MIEVEDVDGIPTFIDYEVVDYDEYGPLYEPYPVRVGPPRPGSKEHRDAIEPYVSYLLWAHSQAPTDIAF